MDPRFSAKRAYNTSKAAGGKLVNCLLGGSALKYVGHRACVRRASTGARKYKNYVEIVRMARQK